MMTVEPAQKKATVHQRRMWNPIVPRTRTHPASDRRHTLSNATIPTHMIHLFLTFQKPKRGQNE